MKRQDDRLFAAEARQADHLSILPFELEIRRDRTNRNHVTPSPPEVVDSGRLEHCTVREQRPAGTVLIL
jgi:hypothetical protein